jgi:hypothetical protein
MSSHLDIWDAPAVVRPSSYIADESESDKKIIIEFNKQYNLSKKTSKR